MTVGNGGQKKINRSASQRLVETWCMPKFGWAFSSTVATQHRAIQFA